MNLLQRNEMSPGRIPTTGAPCTPVTNAPAIYQHNYQTNIQDMGDVIKETKSIISPCVAKSSAETYIATSTTSSLSNSVACGEFGRDGSASVELFCLCALTCQWVCVLQQMWMYAKRPVIQGKQIFVHLLVSR